MLKRYIGAAVAAGSLVAFAIVPAVASNSGNGSDYGTMPGYGVSTSKTVCADHGSFDAFGKDASLGIEKVHATFLGSYPGPGTDGTQTGINNSTLCGNPQN
ncbi:MAG: hypothetical protein Q8P13_03240 [bacterium]|nr:hypothetical protein [bacterium]